MADLAPDTPTLGSVFSAAGYRTAYIGKWHVGHNRMPDQVGYQEFIEPRGPARARPVLQDEIRIPGDGPRSLLSAVTDQAPEETEPFVVLNAAADKLRAWARSPPFFLFVSTQSPHVPCIVPRSYAERYDPAGLPIPDSFADDLADKPASYRHFNWQNFCRIAGREGDLRRFLTCYYGSVSLIDDAFGQVIRALEETGLRGNTHIIFASDHGELAGAHGLIGKDELLCDELIRVPLVIAPPRAADAPESTPVTRDEFVTLTDLFATCLDLAGLKHEPPPAGRSLRPLLAGEAGGSFPDEVFAAHHGSQFFNTVRSVRTTRFKYVFRPHEIDELYDLVDDPGERRNRIADPALAGLLRDLRRRLVEWLAAVGDPAASGARNQLLADLPGTHLIGDSMSKSKP